jgi:hypothetical protein
MRTWAVIASAALAAGLFPAEGVGDDRIETKDGRVLYGDILFHNETEYYVSTSRGVERVRIADVSKIDFSPAPPDTPGPETREAGDVGER